ncbi:uncharacterized protein METZ01_LOCUS199431, partial [marine metagenome]
GSAAPTPRWSRWSRTVPVMTAATRWMLPEYGRWAGPPLGALTRVWRQPSTGIGTTGGGGSRYGTGTS